MELPNFFFADLGAEEALNRDLVRDAALNLKRNKRRYLDHRSTASIVRALDQVGEKWMNPDDPFRKFALAEGPGKTGFSRPVLERGLDEFFGHLKRENLEVLLAQDLGHLRRLDDLATSKEERYSNRSSIATGPELLVHITAGNLPVPTLCSMAFGLLVGSSQFIKCAKGTAFLPRLFAHSIYEIEPKLGACIELAEWPGGEERFEEPLFAEADCVTATGSDETLKSIRDRLPLHVRFVGYGHKVSYGFIGRECLEGYLAKETVQNAAHDIAAWDQLGCLSPHTFYVEKDGSVKASHFAESLGQELEAIEKTHPRGPLDTQSAAAISSRRDMYELRAANLPDTSIWSSPESTAWTVVYEADPIWQNSCLNRFVYVKEVEDLDEVLRVTEPMRGKVSTVGLAVAEEELEACVTKLARWGVTRVCPLGRMQRPPLTWRHDGRSPLAELITWTDWEQ